MRVCVTGAGGYIGGWLLAELYRRGHEVHAQDLHHPNASEIIWESFHSFDLCDRERREGWLEEVRPEVVIHLAALYGRVWGEVDMAKTAGVNSGLTAALARDCTRLGTRLMFMSSSEVYGDSANQGTCYTRPKDGLVAPLRPMNMYGLTKKWGEEAAALYAPAGLMVTRLNMPYGPAYWAPRRDEVPHTSGRPGQIGYNVLHSMVWQAEHGYPLTVHRGTRRCLTWVGDSVRGLALIMEAGRPGTWNVSRNDDHREVLELANKVTAMTSSISKVYVQDPPAQVTMRKSLDSTPLSELGWGPEVELDDGMKLTWEYFRRFDRHGVWRG